MCGMVSSDGYLVIGAIFVFVDHRHNLNVFNSTSDNDDLLIQSGLLYILAGHLSWFYINVGLIVLGLKKISVGLHVCVAS